MRTKHQIFYDAAPDLIPASCLDVNIKQSRHYCCPLYSTTAQSKQWCPLVTRGRLMTVLGISLITTILLLLQCVPASYRPDIYCCHRGHDSLNSARVIETVKTIDASNDDLSDNDLIFTDQEYDNTAEGNERIRYKHTKRQLPQCIIIGVRKGGTRALLEFLDLHPGIQAEKREMHFFDEDENYALGLEWYRKKMPWSYSDQITVEKTPAYFVEDRVPERIFHMNNSVKLLLIVRDPIDRTISDYMQIHSSKLAKGRFHEPFEELVIDRESGVINKNYKPIRRSIYHRHMERWLRWFDLSQFHIINGENLVRDPVEELRKVETFLGLEHRLSQDQFYFNQTKGFYCMHLQNRQKCLAQSKGRDHPNIRPRVMQQLRDFYRPLNSKFYDMVGVNFGWKQ